MAGTLAISDTKARNAKPQPKPYRIPDEGGLYLWVTPSGGKHWRMRYKRQGREGTLTFGGYPGVGLADARSRRDKARARLQRGDDPSQAEPEPTPTLTFRQACETWLDAQSPLWKPHHAEDVRASLKREVWPELGDKPIDAITGAMVMGVLRAIQARDAIELAHRIRRRIEAVYAFTAGSGTPVANPATGLTGLPAVVRKGRRPAVLGLDEARAVLAAVEGTPAHPVTLLAHRLLALTALRPGELRGARWVEFDLDGPAPTWRVPALRMKHKERERSWMKDHVVPLSTQAVEAISAVRVMSGRSDFVFPSWGDLRRSLSENALIYLLNRAGQGGRHVPHGWRATFSTVMNERRPADRQAIDLMLAHRPAGAVEAAYNRAQHMARRREIAQEWADLLLNEARPAAELLEVRRR